MALPTTQQSIITLPKTQHSTMKQHPIAAKIQKQKFTRTRKVFLVIDCSLNKDRFVPDSSDFSVRKTPGVFYATKMSWNETKPLNKK
jgi:hypothetical protein